MLLGGGKVNINNLITLRQNRPIENSNYNYRIINKKHWRSGINSNNLIHIKTKNIPKSSIVFGNINLRSVRNKSSVFIDTVLDGQYDIVTFTESWLSENDNILRRQITPDGYNLFDVPRKNRMGGGVGVLLKSTLKGKFACSGETRSYEYLEIHFSSLATSILLLIIYRPPYSQNHPVTTNTFFDEIKTHLDSLIIKSQKLIISGDFNIHMDDPQHPHTLKFKDILHIYGLTNNIEFHTQIIGHTLDLVITRDIDNIIALHTEPGPYISDHRFVKTILNLRKTGHEVRQTVFRDTKNIDMTSFRLDLVNSALIKTDREDMTVDDLAKLYDESLREIIDRHAPEVIKVIKIKPSSPWYNSKLHKMKVIKRSLEQKMLRTKKKYDINKFKEMRNLYTLKCEEVQTQYLKNRIINCNGNSGNITCVLMGFLFFRYK